MHTHGHTYKHTIYMHIMYTHIYMCVYIYTYVTYTHMIYTYVYIHTYMYIILNIMYMYVYMYTHVYMCIYITCIYIVYTCYTCIHIYIQIYDITGLGRLLPKNFWKKLRLDGSSSILSRAVTHPCPSAKIHMRPHRQTHASIFVRTFARAHTHEHRYIQKHTRVRLHTSTNAQRKREKERARERKGERERGAHTHEAARQPRSTLHHGWPEWGSAPDAQAPQCVSSAAAERTAQNSHHQPHVMPAPKTPRGAVPAGAPHATQRAARAACSVGRTDDTPPRRKTAAPCAMHANRTPRHQ